jgi:sterol desaturase/sphingolipid hydroxylase (fatty acid hydroxylase superfamily)
MSALESLARPEGVRAGLDFLSSTGQRLLFSPGSNFSLISLIFALAIAVIVSISRRSGTRRVPTRVMIRAMFPRRIWRSASGKADIGFFIFNVFIASILFGWALFSSHVIGAASLSALESAFDPAQPGAVPVTLRSGMMTIAMFLAYEFAYWCDHYLKHNVSALWHFHKVHHTADTLSPLTNFRVHPVDTVIFFNIVALFTGVTEAGLRYGLGADTAPFTLGGSNVFMIAFYCLLLHLQHSQVWISFPGRLGRIILSPAHHQLHHSSDPEHFNSNYGNAFAVWDRLFGTLRMPTKANQRLTFGVREVDRNPHSVTATLIAPFRDSLASLAAICRQHIIAR